VTLVPYVASAQKVCKLVLSTDLGYVHIDTSPSPGFHLRIVCHSYKLHVHEWSVRGHLCKHITQRMSIDNLQ